VDRLINKVAIITGGAQGIGAATVRRFCEEGARVIIADVKQAAGEALAAATGAILMPVDVSDHSAVGNLVEFTVRHYGGLDTIVSNAAVFNAAPVEEMTPDIWNHVIAVNLTATYHLAHFAAPHLRARPGASMVLISSVQGMVGFNTYAAYAASKGGLIGLMRQLATELAPVVRVNSISPGTIQSNPETPLDTATEKEWAMKHLLQRIGLPHEVANAALFLASDEASFITGHNLVVDGGLTARGK
jgi:NAD(P)-dependent dehydrogenase (short-subunit alcohol dehydrogenase family)